MKTVATSMTIADYCQAMQRGEIVSNRDYQRSNKVWPQNARSFLIETILLDFPMPKLSLYQITDIRSRKTYKEIVDGQQRSTTILDFFKDKLRLSRSLDTVEVSGKTFSELPDDYRQRFLEYQLSIDLFIATTPVEVREVFRRINSYTVPLNPEEQRHAKYQGAFKWFIHHLSRDYGESFNSIGLFSQRQLVRMNDAKLITEISHALLFGITTTDKRILDGLYGEKDDAFPEESELNNRITFALDQILEWTNIHRTAIMKHYHVYSLALAISHMVRPTEHLNSIYTSPSIRAFNQDEVVSRLAILVDALENPEQHSRHKGFIEASSSRTNVKSQREERFVTYCQALEDGEK